MKKGIGDKVLSWFVVAEDDEPSSAAREDEPSAPQTASTKESVAPAARANVAPPVSPPVVRPGTAYDARAFSEVYARANIPDDARERLARVMELVGTRPAEATLDVKRAIVSASLSAFGVPVAQVVATCDAALLALDAHTAEGRARTEQVLGEAQARIDKLSAEVAEIRRLMEVQVRAQEDLVRACSAERERVRETRDFFRGSEVDHLAGRPAHAVEKACTRTMPRAASQPIPLRSPTPKSAEIRRRSMSPSAISTRPSSRIVPGTPMLTNARRS